MTFGEKLQKLRKARGWTQEQLAEQIGVSRQSLSKWESDATLPDTANVILLSDLFGVSTDYLLRAEGAAAENHPLQGADKQAAPIKKTPPSSLMAGAILAVLGLLVWLPLRIMALINPVELHVMSGPDAGVYTGIQGYIRQYDLQLPYYAGILLLIVGIVVILVPLILKWLYGRKQNQEKKDEET